MDWPKTMADFNPLQRPSLMFLSIHWSIQQKSKFLQPFLGFFFVTFHRFAFLANLGSCFQCFKIQEHTPTTVRDSRRFTTFFSFFLCTNLKLIFSAERAFRLKYSLAAWFCQLYIRNGSFNRLPKR